MTKVALLAPEGHSGQIQASGSGQAYSIDPDGTVIVDHEDVGALLNGGFQHVPRKASTEQRVPAEIQARSPGSTEVGASAIDPAKRQANQRQGGAEVLDRAGAQPLFADGGDGNEASAGSADQQAAKAADEVRARQAVGADLSHASQLPGTGHETVTRLSADDHAAAREASKEDADRGADELAKSAPPEPETDENGDQV